MKYYVSRHQRTLGNSFEADSPEAAAKMAVKALSDVISGDDLTVRWNVQMDPYSRTGEWLFADTTTLQVEASWVENIAAPSDQDLYSKAEPEEEVVSAVAEAEPEAPAEGGSSAIAEEAAAEPEEDLDAAAPEPVDGEDAGDEDVDADAELEASSEGEETDVQDEDVDEADPTEGDDAGDAVAGDAAAGDAPA